MRCRFAEEELIMAVAPTSPSPKMLPPSARTEWNTTERSGEEQSREREWWPLATHCCRSKLAGLVWPVCSGGQTSRDVCSHVARPTNLTDPTDQGRVLVQLVFLYIVLDLVIGFHADKSTPPYKYKRPRPIEKKQLNRIY